MGEQAININEADELTLATLPGISVRLAERIVAYREEHGPFAEVAGLTAVSGISPRMIEQMAERITTTPTSPNTNSIAEPTSSDTDGTSSDVPLLAPQNPEASTAVTIEPPPVTIQDTAKPVIIAEPEAEIFTPIAKVDAPALENQQELLTAVPLTPSSPQPPQTNSLISHLIAALFGAILGTTLTLSILYGFNETLQYGSQVQADDVQNQLEAELQTLQQEQEQLQNELDSLNSQMEMVTTTQADTAVTAATAQANIDELQTAAADLQSRADDLNQRLEAVAASAQDFDTFLTGLRDLLVNVAGPAPTPTPTATPEQTPTTAVSTTPTATATATTDPAATRTPRPTATRIGLATSTP